MPRSFALAAASGFTDSGRGCTTPSRPGRLCWCCRGGVLRFFMGVPCVLRGAVTELREGVPSGRRRHIYLFAHRTARRPPAPLATSFNAVGLIRVRATRRARGRPTVSGHPAGGCTARGRRCRPRRTRARRGPVGWRSASAHAGARTAIPHGAAARCANTSRRPGASARSGSTAAATRNSSRAGTPRRAGACCTSYSAATARSGSTAAGTSTSAAGGTAATGRPRTASSTRPAAATGTASTCAAIRGKRRCETNRYNHRYEK